MAEINIERKPQRSPWPIVLALIALIAIAVAVWYYTQQPAEPDDTVQLEPTTLLHTPVPGASEAG